MYCLQSLLQGIDMTERKLASFRTINSITPIEGADFIALAQVDGWQCVVGKHDFSVGDVAVYFEIDSWLPLDSGVFCQFEFLHKNKFTWNESIGTRIKSMTLRGSLSQGLLLPYKSLNVDPEALGYDADLTDILGVKLWEREIPACMNGIAVGSFPSWGRRPDATRIQNIQNKVLDTLWDEEFEITVKRNGTSCSIYRYQGKTGVCSKNWEIENNSENAENVYLRIFNMLDASNVLQKLDANVMILGEIFGPGIEANFENVRKHTFEVFNIFDIDKHRFFTRDERLQFIEEYNQIAGNEILCNVPTINVCKLINFGYSRLDLIQQADGPSAGNGKFREGLVFKSTNLINGDVFMFKVVGNRYLLKTGD